jgi:hypothetical protein
LSAGAPDCTTENECSGAPQCDAGCPTVQELNQPCAEAGGICATNCMSNCADICQKQGAKYGSPFQCKLVEGEKMCVLGNVCCNAGVRTAVSDMQDAMHASMPDMGSTATAAATATAAGKLRGRG